MDDSTPILLQRLINHLMPDISQNLIDKYFLYFLRILSSRLSNNLDSNENNLKNMISQKILLISNESNTLKHTANTNILRFQELCDLIYRSKTLRQKNGILTLFLKLSNSSPKNSKINNVESLFKRKLLENNNNGKMEIEIEKPISLEKKEQNINLTNVQKVTFKGNISLNLTENELLRDLLYVFQGIDGHYIVYNKSDDLFQIRSSVPINESIRKLINSLTELGWLYKNLNEFIALESKGLIREALTLSIKEELNEYFKLIAILENKRIENERNNSLEFLSLRKIKLWAIEPLERLKWLNIICDTCKNLTGGAVISAINSYKKQGCPLITELIDRILEFLCVPWMKFVNGWIYNGELKDNNNEFFVVVDNSIIDPEITWQNKYKIDPDKIPSLIDQEDSLRILIAGKSVNFMKKDCNFSDFVINIPPIDNKASFKDIQSFKSWVKNLSNTISQNLLYILFNKFHLETHFQYIKKYLLLGQGDLMQNLMDEMTPELSKPASQLYKHNLINIFDNCIRNSNAQYQSIEFLSRIEIKLLEMSSGDCGWDIFSLDYRIEPPLTTIFTRNSRKGYLKLFNLLWKIKRIENTLSGVWRQQMNIFHYLEKNKGLNSEFHRCHLIRNEMVHFVRNLLNYIMVEIIESAYQNFIDRLKKCGNIDDIIKLHEDFVIEVLEKALLKEKTEPLLKQLVKIMQLVIRVKLAQDDLFARTQEEFDKILQKRQEIKIKNILEEEDEEIFNDNKDRSIGLDRNSFKMIDQIRKDYEEAIYLFQNLLKKDDSIDNLKFLSFRLDFNEYYNNQIGNKFVDMGFQSQKMLDFEQILTKNNNEQINLIKQEEPKEKKHVIESIFKHEMEEEKEEFLEDDDNLTNSDTE